MKKLMRFTLFALLIALLSVSCITYSPAAEAAVNTAAHWGFNEGSGKVTRENISNVNDPISYVFNNAVYKPSTDPQWKTDGISGGALLFDGYSTWVQRSPISTPSTTLSVEAWVAPRSYEWGDDKRLSAIINQHNRDTKQGFILGMFRTGTWSFQIGLNDGNWYEAWSYEPLPKFEWSHITATYNSAAGEMVLYLNGKKVASNNRLPLNATIVPSTNNLMIGKNNQSITNGCPPWEERCRPGVYSYNMFNGLIDEVKVYNSTLIPSEVQSSYDTYLSALGGNLPTPDLVLDPTVYAGDKHRPIYHAIPGGHWINEPHAPLYFNGQYHLFYQNNPQGPYWHYIHWGHWVSDDMVHWRNVNPALAPNINDVDPDGSWTGSSVIDDNGNPALFFTAGDNSRGINNQNIALARSTFSKDGNNDLVNWEKNPELQIVQQAGQGKFGDFRDPFVFKDGNLWYMLVGSGVEGQGGTALVYTSTDMMKWDYKGPLFTSNSTLYPHIGPIWELPAMRQIGVDQNGNAKYIFTMGPQGPGAVTRVYYWIGTWDKANFKFIPDPDHLEPRTLDAGGFTFTGPSLMKDPVTGKLILFTITQGQRTSPQEYNSGWAHNAGLPVELSLRTDGQVGIQPISQLQSLRGAQLVNITTDTSFDQANTILSGIQSDTLEIEIELDGGQANEYGLKVRKSPQGEEETILYFKKSSQEFFVNREKSSLDTEVLKGVQGDVVNLNGENVKLRIFLDKSMIEGYLNGLKSLTTRVYPTRNDALGLKLWGNANEQSITVKSLKIWEMNSSQQHVSVTGVSLNTSSTDVYVGAKKSLYATVAPSNATKKEIIWTSNNTAVATVTNGQVLGKSPGTAVITAKTRDGNFISTSSVAVLTPPVSEALRNHSFETGDLTDWIIESGNAFTNAQITSDTGWSWGGPYNHDGNYHLTGFRNAGDDEKVGVLRSQNFIIGGNGQINFLIGGGQDNNNLYAALVRTSDDKILFKSFGPGSHWLDMPGETEAYTRKYWDASQYIGTQTYIKIVDNKTSNFAHFNVDDFNVPVKPGSLSKPLANHDFETGNLSGWTVVNGTAFTDGDVTSDTTWWGGSFNQQGTYHYWGHKNGDDTRVGEMKSANFVLGGDGQINLQVAGGQDINNVYVALVRASDNAVLFKETGVNSETYTRRNWDATAYLGETLYIKVIDNATGAWGHINIDDVNVPVKVTP